MFRRLVREPLVHFLAAGAALFAAFSLTGAGGGGEDDRTTITVDRRALLAFMQYRSNAFEPEAFNTLLDSMTQDERQRLIDAYVEEEALYREAAALGLDQSDYIIRQRMVQKVEFLLGDVAFADSSIDEEELRAYYNANLQNYVIEPSLTFTHVFFDTERRGGDAADAAARDLLARLRTGGAGFNDATAEGDRFPFLRNYVERTFRYVADHFGEDFADALSGVGPADGWSGPFRSAYGLHIVLVSQRTERSIAPLEDVRDRVEADFLRDRSDAALAEIRRAVRERYIVEIGDLDAEPAE
jgi:parvulin-like peptidyl-prolyl isomerase